MTDQQIADSLTKAQRRGLLDFGWLSSRLRRSFASKGLIEIEHIGYNNLNVKATPLGLRIRAILEQNK